jgi:8-oxo-dGTP pyrophosphatase MutT (NUDIX family)
LPIVFDSLKRRAFWIVARTCIALYRTFPVFGTLRASIGILQQDDRFLVIHRNDGRGVSLPGGISGWKETAEETLRREIREETGLRVTQKKLKLKYYSDADVPCSISVFEVQASGDLQNSWEGSARWTTLSELEPRLVASQRPVIEVMKRMAVDAALFTQEITHGEFNEK